MTRPVFPLLCASLFAATLAPACNATSTGGGGDAGKPDMSVTQGPDLSGPPNIDMLLASGCETGKAPAAPVPLYMLFVLDGSGSMSQNGKWQAVVPALESIWSGIAAENNTSLGVGLTVFGDQNDKTITDNFAGPYNSMDVPLAYVDAAQLAKLNAYLNSDAPYLGTPTYEVLSGMYPLLRALTPAAPLLSGGKRIVVLMTDGVPDTDMPAGYNEIPWSLALAAEESSFSPASQAIDTFVVGVGHLPPQADEVYSAGFLSQMAINGGTRSSPTCDPLDPGTTPALQANLCYFQINPPAEGSPSQAEILALQQQFINALNTIRGEATLCTYTLSRINVNNGSQVDPSEVNVVYTNGTTGKETLIPQSATSGWTYDDPTAPTEVILHGAACSEIVADPKGSVTVVLGCKTVLP